MRYYQDIPKLENISITELAPMHGEFMGSYHYFCEMMLGFWDMNEEHKDLCEFLQNDNHKFRMVLIPRHTFKSSVITQGYSLWKLYKNPDLRILIYSDSSAKSEGFLRGIKNHIEGKCGKSRVRELIGELETDPKSGKWNDSQIIISTREKKSIEPSVDTGGIETSKVGRHYDIIIFDDIVSDLNVTTKGQMDKVYECYQKSLSLLKPGGEVLVVGTRWHLNDAYGRIINENKESNVFGIFVRDAETKNEKGELIFGNIGLNREFLDHQRNRQGSYIYSCLYRNNPVSSDEAIFKAEDFKFYGKLKKSEDMYKTGMYPNLFITCTLDPAGEGKDFTAGVVLGTDSLMKMYVLELMNVHSTPDYMIEWVVSMNRKYRFNRFGMETIFFRGMLRRSLEIRVQKEREADPNFKGFSIEEFSPSAKRGESKYARILSLQPYHERGDILFPGDCIEGLGKPFSDLAYQMTSLTPSHMPEPNDLLDALAYHTELIEKGSIAEKQELPKNSPAWLEDQWVSQHNRMQRHVPRRYRTKFERCLN